MQLDGAVVQQDFIRRFNPDASFFGTLLPPGELPGEGTGEEAVAWFWDEIMTQANAPDAGISGTLAATEAIGELFAAGIPRAVLLRFLATEVVAPALERSNEWARSKIMTGVAETLARVYGDSDNRFEALALIRSELLASVQALSDLQYRTGSLTAICCSIARLYQHAGDRTIALQTIRAVLGVPDPDTPYNEFSSARLVGFSQALAVLLIVAVGPGPYMVRSSTNAEDLDRYPGAGLYDSFAQSRLDRVADDIKRVYSSLYTVKAVADRRRVGMDETAVYPAVIVQNMSTPAYSFVVHSNDPTRAGAVLIELVQGLGEALVSGSERYQGSAHRFRYDPLAKTLERLAYANKSYRMDAAASGGVQDSLVDYSGDPFADSVERMSDSWRNILLLLGATAKDLIEPGFGAAQDIEGTIECAAGALPQLVFLQSRTQVRRELRSAATLPSRTGITAAGQSALLRSL